MKDVAPITYETDFHAIVNQIQQTKRNVYQFANQSLIDLYWNIGQVISKQVASTKWGKSIVSELAKFIVQQAPKIKGFSDKNLWRMKQFYETYQDNPKLSPLVREIPWTHNTIIFSRCKSAEEREFYLRLMINDKLAKRDLERQINSSLFERTAIGNQTLSAVLRELQPNDKDDEVVEYALSRHLSPTLISQYALLLPDKKLLQAKLHEISARLEVTE